MKTIYCTRCGTAMDQRFVEGRMREVCPHCGHIFYRNPVPAVGVVVSFDGDVVLVQRKFEPRVGCWGLPAGYMELGESAEEAATRECHEETSLLVQINHLLGVYSYGAGDFSGLVIIYAATVMGGELQAGDDAMEVGVFGVDALPNPMAFRTHLQAIERWRQQERLATGPTDALVQPERGVLVRRAHREDDQRILELLTLVPQHDYSSEEMELAAAALFHDRLNDPDRPILVAEVDGAVAGFAALAFRQTFTGWHAAIDDLAVDSVYRRRGLGQALVEAAFRLAQARNCRTLHIDTAQGSPEAQAFYRACGFAEGRVATLWVG
ncbi:MAG: GNAT family N-acetyltransferase [Chloroflexales bacterium]|nr:GNAT family N-acetyltransferase [Chloroflexales bacterium]